MKQLLILTTALLTPLCLAGEPDLGTDAAKINYSVGYQIGGDFKLQGVEMQPDTVIRGIQDALSGAQPLMTAEEMNTTMGELGKRIADQRTREKHLAKTRIEKENMDFLTANAKKEGVVTTPSGLQYKIIEPGTGRTPGATDTVTVNYRGSLIDGKEFDSSAKHGKPASFRVDGVIAGWSEALQMMQEGAKWQLFIPHRLAYGEKGPLREKTLIFDVELLSVDTPEIMAPEAEASATDAAQSEAPASVEPATPVEPVVATGRDGLTAARRIPAIRPATGTDFRSVAGRSIQPVSDPVAQFSPSDITSEQNSPSQPAIPHLRAAVARAVAGRAAAGRLRTGHGRPACRRGGHRSDRPA